MTNSDHTRSGGHPGHPGSPAQPHTYGRQPHPQPGHGQQAPRNVPEYNSRQPAAPVDQQGYAPDGGYAHPGYAPQQPDYAQGHAPYGQMPAQPAAGAGGYNQSAYPADQGYASPGQYALQPPVNDYYYPQGQNILPEVPPLAMPPGMHGQPESVGDPAYRQHPASYAQDNRGDSSFHHPSYTPGASDHGVVEQISQRLVQLQNQYEQEMASARQAAPQQGYYAEPAHDAYQRAHVDAGNQYQPHHLPQLHAAQPHVPQRQVPQYHAPQAPYHQMSAHGPQHPEPVAYQAEEAGYDAGYQDQYDQQQQGEHTGGYAPEAYGQYGAETMITHQAVASRGKGKFALAGAFLTALVVGGGAAYTYKYTDLLRSDNVGIATPIVKAGSEPVKILSDRNSNDKESQNLAMHERLSSDGAAAPDSRERLADLAKEAASSALAPAASAENGLLPLADQTAAAETGAPRRVKTLIVRPDGTILQPAGSPYGDDATTAAVPGDVSDEAKAGAKEAAAELASAGTSADDKSNVVIRKQMRVVPAEQQPNVELPAGKASAKKIVTAAKTVERPKQAAPAGQVVSTAPAGAAEAVGDAGSPYVVQVTSRDSPSGALAAFADMQQKYPSLIGSYEPDIERADLGDKGVWYRLRVGPVAGKTAAADLCDKLKASGHPGCFVRRK